jgi:tetratricopeptide (TPR) repeat protein
VALARSLHFLGQAANSRGDYATARALLEECIAICRRDPRLQPSGAESLLANSARDQGDFATARSLYESALTRKTALSERGHFLSNRGWLAYYEGNLEDARALQEASLQLRRQLNEPRAIAVSLAVLGKIAFARGDHRTARALYAESLPLHRAVGNQWGVALVLEGLSDLAATDQPSRALQLAGAAARVRSAIGRPIPPAERPIHDRNLMPARRALTPEAQAEAWAAGLAMSPEQSATEALIELGSRPLGTVRPADSVLSG